MHRYYPAIHPTTTKIDGRFASEVQRVVILLLAVAKTQEIKNV